MKTLLDNLPHGYYLKDNKIYKGMSDNPLRKHKPVWVATIYEQYGQVCPTHGYFPPHYTGNKLQKHFGNYFNPN